MFGACESLGSIIEGVISNFVFLLLTVGLWILFYRFVALRSLLRFFGIGESRRLRVYISQREFLPAGVSRKDGIPTFHGSVVGFAESIEARGIQELFVFSLPGVSPSPWSLSPLFVADVRVEIEPADLPPADLPPAGLPPAEPRSDCSYVSLGTPLYNTASGFTESRMRSDLGFRGTDNAELHIPGLRPILKATNQWHAVLVRFTFNDIKIFYAAGFHDVGTAAAAFYLRHHWRRLHKRFGDSDFFVVLTMTSGDYRSPTVVAENTL